MAEASEAMKAMARRIAEQYDLDLHRVSGDLEAVALAAIIETQRADAELVETVMLEMPGIGVGLLDGASLARRQIASAIRTGNHYAKDENNG